MATKRKRFISALLSVFLLITILAGCSSSNSETKTDTTGTSEAPTTTDKDTTSTTGIDTSKKVELQFYMLGSAPKDLSVVEAEVNKLTEKDLNATVKFNFTTWTDWEQKYKLLLSSGQSVDLIYTAEWTQFQAYAKKGAFLPLDDILPKAAPKVQAYVPQDMWDAVKIDNKIYTVPATYQEYVTNGFVWREDLRQKYNLPKPVDLASFEEYLDGIKKNEPTMMPLSVNSDVRGNLLNLLRELRGWIGGPIPYGVNIQYDKPGEAYSYWGSDEQLQDLETIKRWQDKGFFSKNVLNVKDTLQDPVTSGKAAAILGDNPTRYNDTNNKMKSTHPDWDLGYTPYATVTGFATPVHPIHNGFAVPASSKNAERALAFYEKMVMDKTYNWLTEYGIEGKNFEVDSEGHYKMLGDSNSNGFQREGMQGWAWRNPEFMLFDKSYDGVDAIFKELDKVKKPDLYLGFAEDYTAYQAERAALEQVEKQYLFPLQAGIVADVKGGMETFMTKAKQAGLDKVQSEYIKQWNAYVAEKGIQ
ncbi:ABC transporter substrate-binding protein [Paenibacillus selenitireducens]|uniref:ABC transporter substrate-binding protein n=2 Tax=Paenibacillus selenitireducens TaxID=1324314 RepID=A0A1T2X8Z2_9BACL|nr:extracellular solute-binding protein [Paenibacillus selenitireducens]OPA76331.1 ABC transporter substrate-binding protein [Paenibacillus selenitireducens]